MHNYIISCCSTADLSKEHFLQRDIKYVCYHYEIDGKHYLDDLGETMDFADFYKAMEDGADTKTSQLNADEFEEYFIPFLEQGIDIIHISLSSGLSGAYNSAEIAAKLLFETINISGEVTDWFDVSEYTAIKNTNQITDGNNGTIVTEILQKAVYWAEAEQNIDLTKYDYNNGIDYRYEVSPNPICSLQNRKCDDVCVGREPLCQCNK